MDLFVDGQVLKEGFEFRSQSILRLKRTLTATCDCKALPEPLVPSRGNPRITIVDYGSHPFIRSTSARLRSQGLSVTYAYQKCEPCPSYGDLQNRIEVGEVGIDIDGVFQAT